MPKAVADLTKDLPKAEKLLLQEVQKALPQMSAELLEAGLKIAHAAHEGQTRASGEPYLTHVIHVARITLELLPDEKALLAALLHDAEEDHPGMLPEIKKKFGAEVADLVAGLTKMSRTTLAGAERNAEGVLNMLLTMVRDPRVALVKLADRLHNMETIGALPHQKQERIARETLGVYAPLADRLGCACAQSTPARPVFCRARARRVPKTPTRHTTGGRKPRKAPQNDFWKYCHPAEKTRHRRTRKRAGEAPLFAV